MSSSPISPKGSSHEWQKLQFGKEKPLEPIDKEKAQIPIKPCKLNWFGRFVEFTRRSQSRPAVISRLVTILALSASIVGIPFVVLWLREAGKQNDHTKKTSDVSQKIFENIDAHNTKIQNRMDIAAKIIGMDRFERLPKLDLGDRKGRTDSIDFINPNEMSHPLMRGTDKSGRAFIACKLQHGKEKPFVVTLFERYPQGGMWVWNAQPDPARRTLLEEKLPRVEFNEEEHYTNFKKILDGNDPDLHLFQNDP